MIDNLNGIVTQQQAVEQVEQPIAELPDLLRGLAAKMEVLLEQKPAPDADLPDRARVKDVARWLGLHQNTIYGLIHKGEIPCKVVGKRTYIFEKAALLEWARAEEAT